MKSKKQRIFIEFIRLVKFFSVAALLSAVSKPIWCKENTSDYLLMCILIGVPFGIGRMMIILSPTRYDLGTCIGILVLGCMIGGAIGFISLCASVIKCVLSMVLIILSREKSQVSPTRDRLTN